MLYAVKIHDSVAGDDDGKASRIRGNATEMIVISSATMNPAVAAITSVSHALASTSSVVATPGVVTPVRPIASSPAARASAPCPTGSGG